MSFENENSPDQVTNASNPNQLIDATTKKLSAERKKTGAREFRGMMIRLRENPWMAGPMKALTAFLAGVPMAAHAQDFPKYTPDTSIESVFTVSEPPRSETEHHPISIELEKMLEEDQAHRYSAIETAAQRESPFPESDEVYLLQLRDLGLTIEAGQAAPEYYARVGRPEWTPYQRSLFSSAPVQERFFELHPDWRHLSSQEFVTEYPNMLRTAQSEFRFSNEFRFLTDDVQTAFLEIAPTLKPSEALSQYKFIVEYIGRNAGLAHIVELSIGLQRLLPADHLLVAYINDIGVIEAADLLKPNHKNIVHIDQSLGQMRILRQINGMYILLDAFPAIGGKTNTPEMSLVGKPSGSEYVHVPDATMTVVSVNEAKTSWTWQRSWVSQGALIREQGNELQYQHPRTKQWYDLTGPKAGFFPDADGNVIRPFDSHFEPMDQALIRAASHSNPDQSVRFIPKMWTKEQIMSLNGGEVPTEWKWNEFGSVALRLGLNGEQTNINIHSKPSEDMNDFLGDRTHGCIATYGEYVKKMVVNYGVGSGSTVVVTTENDYDLKMLLAKK